jgi:hypothetical protein
MSKNTSFRVYNISQAERRRILKDTLHGRAVAEQDTIGGRYAAETRTRVVGSASFKYPQLPGSSWGNQGAAVPPEPSLGVAIDEMEPTGTHAEIEQSLQSLREMRDEAGPPPASLPDSPNRRGLRSTRSTPSDVSRRPRRLFRHKKD